MKVISIFFLGIVVLVSTSLGASEMHDVEVSEAAKCRQMSFTKAYKFASAVFVGRVVKVETKGSRKLFTFRVDKYWKGIESKQITVGVTETRRNVAQYKEGRDYLVFAKLNEETEEFWDGRCSRSAELNEFSSTLEEDLEKLGEGKSCIVLGDGKKEDG